MATIETVYLGDLRTEAAHLQSGNKIITDAPTDNHGKGEFFSPTDLVAASLGSCMLTLMAQAATRMGIELKGTRMETTKVMYSDPRRIGEIIIDIYLPADYSDKEKVIMERAAYTCPVGKSLHTDVKQEVKFHYGPQ